jgi:hypothetical protein
VGVKALGNRRVPPLFSVKGPRAAAVLRADQRKEAKRLARIRKRRATADKPGGDKE